MEDDGFFMNQHWERIIFIPKIKKHALQFPVLSFRAGSLLMSTVPSLVYCESCT
jgi:hypothetical protein